MPSTDPVSSNTSCHRLIYWPSTQLHHLVTHTAQLSQLDLVLHDDDDNGGVRGTIRRRFLLLLHLRDWLPGALFRCWHPLGEMLPRRLLVETSYFSIFHTSSRLTFRSFMYWYLIIYRRSKCRYKRKSSDGRLWRHSQKEYSHFRNYAPPPGCKRGHNYGKSFPSIFWEFFLAWSCTFGS